MSVNKEEHIFKNAIKEKLLTAMLKDLRSQYGFVTNGVSWKNKEVIPEMQFQIKRIKTFLEGYGLGNELNISRMQMKYGIKKGK